MLIQKPQYSDKRVAILQDWVSVMNCHYWNRKLGINPKWWLFCIGLTHFSRDPMILLLFSSDWKIKKRRRKRRNRSQQMTESQRRRKRWTSNSDMKELATIIKEVAKIIPTPATTAPAPPPPLPPPPQPINTLVCRAEACDCDFTRAQLIDPAFGLATKNPAGLLLYSQCDHLVRLHP